MGFFHFPKKFISGFFFSGLAAEDRIFLRWGYMLSPRGRKRGKKREKRVEKKREKKRNSKRKNRLVAGKGGAPRAPSFREVNLDFWLKGGGKGGGEGREGMEGGVGSREIQVFPSY